MTTELLVPLDGSLTADSAVAHAAELARRIDGSLHLVRVYVPLSFNVVPSDSIISIPDPVIDMQLQADAHDWLVHRAASVSELNDLPVTFELRTGVPEAEIVLAAAERQSKAIVCTTRGTGAAAIRWIGSVADSVIRHSSVPVLAMSPQAVRRDVRARSVLVLLDGSEASGTIVPHARWLANAYEAKISFLRLNPVPQHTARTILEHVRSTNPDVVALATHGRGLSRVMFGGIADELVRLSERPVLTFRPRVSKWSVTDEGRARHGSALSG